MQSQGTFCPICQEDYNQTDSAPRILPQCGHTVCSKCLQTLLKKPQYTKCPYDNSPFPKNMKKVEDFKINFSLKDYLEEGSQWELCPLHQERLRLLCCTDKVKICDDCVHFGDHKGHDIRNIKQVQPELAKKREELEVALSNYDDYCKGVQNGLIDTQTNFLKAVQKRFEELKWMIDAKHAEFKSQIESFFKLEQKKVTEALKLNSKIREDLADSLSKYRDIFKYNDIFSLIDEDITPLITKFDYELFTKGSKDFNKGFENLVNDFEDSLAEKSMSIVDMEIPFHSLQEVSNNYFELIGYKLSDKDLSADFNALKFKGQLVLKKHDDLLEIIALKKNPEEITFKLEELKSIEKLRIVLDNKSTLCAKNRSAGDAVDERVLFIIMRNLRKITSLELVGNSKQFGDNILQTVAPRLFWRSKDLRTVKFNFEGSKIGSKTIKVLSKTILPQLTRLQSLDLNLSHTNLDEENIQSILKTVSTHLLILENLNLNLQNLPVSDVLSELFVPMPNVKSFCLNLINTGIADTALNSLGTKSLPSMKNLESFALFVSCTEVTDESITKLFENMRNIRELALAFTKTKITDASLEALARSLPSMVNTLQDFVLLLDGTKITDHGVIQLCMSMENVKEFILHLDDTAISDQSVEAFAKTSLPTMKKLVSLGLGLSKTKVTDESVTQLLDNIENLTGLTLNLNSTSVSESFGEVLVRRLAGPMKALKEFEVGLVNTKFSQNALNLVNEIKKDVLSRGNEAVAPL